MQKPIISIVYNSCTHVVKSRLPLIAALQRAGYDVFVVSPEDEATQRLLDFGISHVSIRMTQYGMSLIQNIGTIREIATVLRKLRPVASLHYTVKPNTFGTIAAHQANVPVINNIAGVGRAFTTGNLFLRRLVIELYRTALTRSYKVFFQNMDDMVQFLKLGLVRSEQCVRIPGSGVDLSRFAASPLPEELIRFLFVGRLLKEKGIAEFLESATRLLAERNFNQLHFDLVGEYEEDRAYIPLTELKRLTSQPRVTYHGSVEPEHVDGFMRAASCVVLPSYYGEGVPRVLLEACASGRPIITTDNVGCRDVVEDQINGYKVPIRNIEALSDAMRRFTLVSPEERAEMGARARKIAEKRFDERTVINTYLEQIDNIRATSRIRY